MMLTRRCALLAGLCLAAGCGGRDNPFPEPADPDTAEPAFIDRFGDEFATLFRRSGPMFNPSVMADLIPGPGEPIDLDAVFLGHSLGPAGEKVTYYALDVSDVKPANVYVVIGADGEPVAGQLPVFDSVPGDEGHNDFVAIKQVYVGEDYVANAFSSYAQMLPLVEQGVVAIVDTDVIVDWAMVPAGTVATRMFDGEAITDRGWYDGKLVELLRFDELTATTVGGIPSSNVAVIFADGMGPDQGFATESDGVQTHNVFETLPGDEGYSSLWYHLVGDLAGFDSVTDWPSAAANNTMSLALNVNCPIVAP